MPLKQDYDPNYSPTFHRDNTVTYYVDTYGWYHRKHPTMVPKYIRLSWPAELQRKWAETMTRRGYVKIRGEWEYRPGNLLNKEPEE